MNAPVRCLRMSMQNMGGSRGLGKVAVVRWQRALLGHKVIPQWLYDAGYTDNGLMILPPMALIVVACVIWVQRSRDKELQEK